MAENFRQAPTLYIEGYKGKKDFYVLPGDIMDIIFNELDGKNGNALKLMVVLIGTQNGWKLTEKYIESRTGMAKQNYHRAMKTLQELEFVYIGEKSVTVNLDRIRSKYRDDDSKSNHDDKKSNHDDD